jgi:hypothetical protein
MQSAIVAVLLFTTLLGSNVSAAIEPGFYINGAYYKTSNTYDLVVHSDAKSKLRLYINDSSVSSATAKKTGWATFKSVKLTGNSGKVSFTKQVNNKFKAFNYVRNYTKIDSTHIKFNVVNEAPVKPKAEAVAPQTVEPSPQTVQPISIPTPAPVLTPTPLAPTPPSSSVYYANCTAVRDAGAAPIYPSEPGFRQAFDRDNDGVGCE